MKNRLKLNKKSLLILIMFFSLSMVIVKGFKSKHESVKKVNVESINKKDLVQYISATGNIEASYRQDISLNPVYKVVTINVAEGSKVKKGQTLLELEEKDYINQLKRLEINLKNAKDILNQLQGQEAITRKENALKSIKQGEITLQNAKNNYNDLNKKFTQNKELYKDGYISRNDYQKSEKAVLDAENAVKTAILGLEIVKNNCSNINVSISDKITLQNNQIAIIKSDINSLKNKIEKCHIKSNIDGRVVSLDAKPGQYPKSGDSIVIDDVSKYKVVVKMNQYDVINIKKGQKVVVKVKGLKKQYAGTVSYIGHIAKPKISGMSTGTTDQEFNVDVHVIIHNEDENIKVGYEADLDIIVKEKKQVLSIPFDSVIIDKKKDKSYVFVVGNDKKIEKKAVNIGVETDYDVEILKGIKEGEKYILNPSEEIKEGEFVKILNEGK